MRDVQETLRKLKPILGESADRYWLAYLSEDAEGKRELETAIDLLAARLLGSDVSDPQVHLGAPSRETAAGAFPVGEVVHSNRALHPFGLREEEWIQHVAIFGRSGAGKTNTVFALLDTLLAREKPFLIFDWKRNYRDLLAVTDAEILVHTVGRATVPFRFNPLIPPEHTDPAVWLKKLIEIIAHAYYLGEGVMYLLQEALHAVYREHGIYTQRPETWPTLRDVLRWLESQPVKGRKALWMDSTLRGVGSLCFGHMGRTVNTPTQSDIGSLLEKNVILELDGLTNADKTFLTEALLLWIHHHRLAESDRETFKHAIIIEEAHHILLKQTGGHGNEAITDTILREIRELGEAVILVDQHPSLISIPALGNTHTTIAMNLKHRSDVNAVGAAMLLEDEERDLLGRLPTGWAIVKLQSRWTQPFLIRIPHRKIPKGAVDDARLREIVGRRAAPQTESTETNSARTPSAMDCDPTTLLAQEEQFLLNVIKHPLAGTVERYRHLGLSRRKGNAIREALIARGFLRPVMIPTRSGRTVLTELPDAGREALRQRGHEAPGRPRPESLEHAYWRHQVGRSLEATGWDVRLEEPVNGFTDIVAEHSGRRVAIEIETGKSDWRANLQKNVSRGFRHIRILPTNADAQRIISSGLSAETSAADVQVMLAEDFSAEVRRAGRHAAEPSPR